MDDVEEEGFERGGGDGGRPDRRLKGGTVDRIPMGRFVGGEGAGE